MKAPGLRSLALTALCLLAGHGSVMSPPVRDLPPRAARLLDDPPGFDRHTLDGVYAAIVQFFVQNLQS